MKIQEIKNLVDKHSIKWTQHCLEKMGERDISIAEVEKACQEGEIIEEYPNDYPYPSCLIYAKFSAERIIHVVAGTDGTVLYLITAYIPSTEKFEEDLRTRRK